MAKLGILKRIAGITGVAAAGALLLPAAFAQPAPRSLAVANARVEQASPPNGRASFPDPVGGKATPAGAYLDQAIALLREHHINSPAADWDRIAAHARGAIRRTSTPDGAYDAIRGILRELGEEHSFLMPAGRGSGPRLPPHTLEMPAYTALGRIGFVRVPGFIGSPEEAALYTGVLREILARLDRKGVCGWIIDLRDNRGGNMWPMLNGLDPLLGKGPFGSFRYPAGNQNYWRRLGGTISAEPNEGDGPPAFTLRGAAFPVAVLLSARTASSGEITAAALIGRANVRTFGEPTSGFTTANGAFPLPDGAQLVITTAHIRDRTGLEYKGPIRPDEQVRPEAAPAAAQRWLTSQGCR